MDTKWKKCKIAISFLTFVMGLTMVVTNLVPAAGMAAAFSMEVFHGPMDYQESGEFRYLISEKLSDLLGVATGGKAYRGDSSVSEVTGVEQYAVEESAEADGGPVTSVTIEDFGGNWDDYEAYLAEQQTYYEEMMADMGYGYASEGGNYSGYYYSDPEILDRYMADMAQNKNLRYAVIYQNKLLYSNIDGFTEKAGEEWTGADFYESLDKNVYNFTLWFNRGGDGRVEITKDGLQEDVYDEVYGDGMFSENSRWWVPGYANYTIGESTKDAVIFLAAAKDPKLYRVKSDGSSHTAQYGGRMYQMQQNLNTLNSAAERIGIVMSTAILLLAIAFLMRKSRRQAVERIADLLGKICLEVKILISLVLVVLLTGMSGGVLGQLGWWIRNGLSYYNWSGDYIYEIARMTKAGAYLALWFWLFYLAVLDFRINRKKQKTPVFDLLKEKDFQYPIQKRLVKRQRRTLIAEMSLLLLFAAALCALWIYQEELSNWLTGGYAYDVAYDVSVYEAVAEEMGYSFSIGDAYMLTACVIFTALFVFTAITVVSLKKNHRLAREIGALTDQILAVREGNLTQELVLSEDTDLREAAENLNQIQKGMETALAERMKSERMKVDLVTNVSHDIKTPLTSIVSYVELLRQEENLPQHVKEYIQILEEKAERLRGIVQDVFEVSKATSGQLPIKMELLDMGKLLRQTMADMNDKIEASGLTVRTAIPDAPVSVLADGQRLYRVFQNLLQNALRYSLAGSRIYLALTQEDGQAVACIKNTSSVELSGEKDFTERFVRGDESRTDGGSGLGLSIAKSFTEACGGRFAVETDADLFTVTVRFPLDGQETTGEQL